MSKLGEYIQKERKDFGKLYVEVSYAIDNVSSFLDEDLKKNRKYIIKFPILKQYMELVDSAEKEEKKQGFFSKLFNGDRYSTLLEAYKKDNKEGLTQLKKCSSCACLNCSVNCKFDSCLGCRASSKIAYCDHEKINITLHDDFLLNLTNNSTGNEDKYKVLAILQDCVLDKKYIIIQSITKGGDKFILYYYPGISQDDFGEISDEMEFDYIASIYERTNIR